MSIRQLTTHDCSKCCTSTLHQVEICVRCGTKYINPSVSIYSPEMKDFVLRANKARKRKRWRPSQAQKDAINGCSRS